MAGREQVERILVGTAGLEGMVPMWPSCSAGLRMAAMRRAAGQSGMTLSFETWSPRAELCVWGMCVHVGCGCLQSVCGGVCDK